VTVKLTGDKSTLPRIAALSEAIPQALTKLGGEGTLQEIQEQVVRILKLTPEQIALPHEQGKPRSELDYRMAWARSRLKRSGVLLRVDRGIWKLAVGRPQT
jgi:restriction system protein